MSSKKLNEKLGNSINSLGSLKCSIGDVLSLGVFLESKRGYRGGTEESGLDTMGCLDSSNKATDIYIKTLVDVFLRGTRKHAG